VKHAERVAQIVFIALLIIAASLTYAVVEYHTISFWAGTFAAYMQAVLVALAWWGLHLARQQRQLLELGGVAAPSVSVAPQPVMRGLSAATEENPLYSVPQRDGEVRTLETGFQRVVVVLAALGLLVVAGIIAWLIASNILGTKPGESVPVSPIDLDAGALVAAIGVLIGYGVLLSIARPRPQTQGYAEAVYSIVTMAVPSAVALAVAVIAGYFKYAYAGEIGAGAIAFFLLVQALELFFNAFRNYAGVEEFDQQAIDLQALPLVPMFSSQWILGLRIMVAQSLGIGRRGDGQPGVFARVMPRVLIAVLVVLIGASMFRVVPQGTVAIRERFGKATDEDIATPLAPGLHVTAPWPIDKLVIIPTAQLQQITVGAEEMVPEVNGQRVDFSLWTTRHDSDELEYVTGDGALLGGYVGIWWRVQNPSDFYRHISHSDFYGGDKEDEQNQGRPIYESLIQQNATYAVIHTFGTHGLEDVMATGRGEVQAHCKQYLQYRLDAIHSGIEVVDLTIKDVHPPMGINQQNTVNGVVFGPAMAYEDVVRAREYREAMIDRGNTSKIASVNRIQGESAAIVSQATGDATEQVNKAIGDTAFMSTVGKNLQGHEEIAQDRLLYQTMLEVLPNINKIFVGQNVKRPHVIQSGNTGNSGVIIPVSPQSGQ
jgi:membrane protease subunit HflK